MNEEQLIEFVNWLPTAVPEFQNASPDQIVQSLNQMAESEEGQQMLSQLFTAFQESKQAGNSQMFKKGGKMAAFVNKYGNGGCVSCKKKEILRGGMVNKMAEKMQDGNKMPTKSINSVLFPSMNYDYSNLIKPFDENGNIVDTTQSNNPNIFQRFKSWWQRNTQPTIITEPARSPEQIDSLINPPRPSFFGSPRRKQTTSVLTAQKGGELATMTSAETANNIGLIPMAQDGLSLEPEVKPGGLRGLFWDPTFSPRIDTGAEVGENWTGKRATYYKPNGNLIQILTRKYPAGNTSETIRTIRHPFTPQADTTTVVRNSSSEDQRRVSNSKFNGVFSRNFDKQNK